MNACGEVELLKFDSDGLVPGVDADIFFGVYDIGKINRNWQIVAEKQEHWTLTKYTFYSAPGTCLRHCIGACVRDDFASQGWV